MTQATLETPTQAGDDTYKQYRKAIPSCLIVKIENDEDGPNPLTDYDGAWTLYSFHSEASGSKEHNTDPETLYYTSRNDGASIPNIGLMSKLRAGLAFPVTFRYYGNSSWNCWITEAGSFTFKELTNRSHLTNVYDGFLVWENKPGDMGAKSYADRYQDAKNCIKEYNDYLNGNVWGYSIESVSTDEEGNHETKEEESTWGFIGDIDSPFGIADEILSYIRHYANQNGFTKISVIRPKVQYQGYTYERTEIPEVEPSEDTLTVILSGSNAQNLTDEQVTPPLP